MRLRSLLAAVVLAAAALVPATAATAAAGDTAYNTRQLSLRFPAPPAAISCKVRAIDLDKGTYLWRSERSMGYRNSREIDLAAGVYTWSDCVTYFDEGVGFPIYVHRSYITRHSTGVRVELPAGLMHNDYRAGTVWAQYGSSLRRTDCVVC